MPRRPEIGNVQLYPNRPLKKSDKNGYVLKFYCPIHQKRIRKNCGTRDKREARRILRECRERLLNGEYVASGGAITEDKAPSIPSTSLPSVGSGGLSWQECFTMYREHRKSRMRASSLDDAESRLNIAERILECHREERGLPEGLPVCEVMTLSTLEFLQDQLLLGAESRYEQRSPNSVNSMMGAIMAFVRFCKKRDWINSVPDVQKIKTNEVMKGRPLTTEEYERMLEVTPSVVGDSSATSWQFALKVLWESGFRVGDLMHFHWKDERCIHPVFPESSSHYPTIFVPSTQKNGRVQEIPMLPGLMELLSAVPTHQRQSWIVNPLPMEYQIEGKSEWFRPSDDHLQLLAQRFSNRSLAAACNVSDTTIRRWLAKLAIQRGQEFQHDSGTISAEEISDIRLNSQRHHSRQAKRSHGRLSVDRVSRVITKIGEAANIVVQREDGLKRVKYASAHDLRKGCAYRLINAGVSAETVRIVMRHKSFATTERHYGAVLGAQPAAREVTEKLSTRNSPSLVGGLMGGIEKAPRLTAEELVKLKALLNSI